MDRQEVNKRAIQMARENKIVALEWATGLGKSKAALDIANDNYTNLDYKVLLVVAELAHIQNWEEEAKKWGYIDLHDIFTVTTYASLKHQVDNEFDLIILDEAHHIKSELRLDIIQQIGFDKMVLLSATLGQDIISDLSYSLNDRIITYKISLKEAIEYGIIPEPKVYLIPLILESKKISEVIIEEWGKKASRKTYKCKFEDRWDYLAHRDKYPNTKLEIYCTPAQKYFYLNDKIEYFKRRFFTTRTEAFKNKWLQYGSQRKRFLGELKTAEVKKLLKFIDDKRYICFCTSIEQANELGGDKAIHSKMDGALDTIAKFNNKEINELYAVGMIKEGQNLVDIEAGIIIQLDGQERQFIQKFGRSLRAKDPVQYIFYYKNTRDEEYLENIIQEVDSQFIQELNYEDYN